MMSYTKDKIEKIVDRIVAREQHCHHMLLVCHPETIEDLEELGLRSYELNKHKYLRPILFLLTIKHLGFLATMRIAKKYPIFHNWREDFFFFGWTKVGSYDFHNHSLS